MYKSDVCEYNYIAKKPTISAGSALTSPGATENIDITLEDIDSLKEFTFTVYYEDANLTLWSYTVNKAIEQYVTCIDNDENGRFTFTFESENAVAWNSSDVLVSLKIRALSYADEREYAIGFGDISMTDAVGNNIQVSYNEGKLNVKTFTLGDADGNGAFSIADVVIIKQYVLGYQNAIETIDLRAADFNGDGHVTNEDAKALSKYFAG